MWGGRKVVVPISVVNKFGMDEGRGRVAPLLTITLRCLPVPFPSVQTPAPYLPFLPIFQLIFLSCLFYVHTN